MKNFIIIVSYFRQIRIKRNEDTHLILWFVALSNTVFPFRHFSLIYYNTERYVQLSVVIRWLQVTDRRETLSTNSEEQYRSALTATICISYLALCMCATMPSAGEGGGGLLRWCKEKWWIERHVEEIDSVVLKEEMTKRGRNNDDGCAKFYQSHR